MEVRHSVLHRLGGFCLRLLSGGAMLAVCEHLGYPVCAINSASILCMGLLGIPGAAALLLCRWILLG